MAQTSEVAGIAKDGETVYRVRLARTRELKARLDIWKALDDKSK
jgi:hypothetical protein